MLRQEVGNMNVVVRHGYSEKGEKKENEAFTLLRETLLMRNLSCREGGGKTARGVATIGQSEEHREMCCAGYW